MGDRTIVCGNDFTKPSHEATDLAAALAGAISARLEVVHVLDVSSPIWRDEAARERAHAEASAALADEVARLAATHGVTINPRVVTGSPATRLVEVAAEVGATLVVVAAVGPTPSIFRVGGTAERVAQAAHVPVLLVRDPAPLRAWLRGGALAVSALIGDDAARDHVIDWLRALRAIGHCDVAVLQAYYVDDAARRFGLPRRPVVERDPEIEAYLRRDLEHRVGTLDGRGAVEYQPVLALGRLADHLVDHPAARRAGLLLVGSHRARGVARYSSVAAGVIHLAEVSVLVVPDDAPTMGATAWPRYRRVAVATDFSRFAAEAIRHAYGLAAAARGEVAIVHVLEPKADQAALDEARAALHRMVPDRPPPGVTTRVEVIAQADIAEAIVRDAARIGADCIVIASHGRSGVRKLLLGSVAHGVVQRSDRPVVVVRPPADA